MDIKYNNNSFINSSSIIFVPQKSTENNSSESNISSSSINEMILSDNSADKTKSNQALFNNTVSISENDLKISDTDDNSELYVEDEQNDSFSEISTTFKKKSSKGNLIKHCKTHVAINNNEKNSFFYNIKEIKCNNFNTDEKIDYDQKKFHKKIIQKNFDTILKNFETAFKKEDKILLISALNDLNYLSVKYDFPYINDLSMKWKRILTNCHLKFSDISINMNIIQEILEKMFSEIENQKNEFSYRSIISGSSKTIVKKILKNQKKINPLSINLFHTGNLDVNTIDNLINELDNNDEKNFTNKDKKIFPKKSINNCKYNSDKNLKDFDIYGYPFKDESYCEIF